MFRECVVVVIVVVVVVIVLLERNVYILTHTLPFIFHMWSYWFALVYVNNDCDSPLVAVAGVFKPTSRALRAA